MSLDKLLLFITADIMGGIPPPSRGIVGKNRSTRSKTTVRSKKVFPLEVRRGPHYITALDNSRIKDKRPLKEMLDRVDMLSVNQTAAQIKLTEAWKASKDIEY